MDESQEQNTRGRISICASLTENNNLEFDRVVDITKKNFTDTNHDERLRV